MRRIKYHIHLKESNRWVFPYLVVPKKIKIVLTSCKLIRFVSVKFYRKIQIVAVLIILAFFIAFERYVECYSSSMVWCGFDFKIST